jgi:hypothetical protein
MIEAGHSPFAVRLRTGLSVRVIDMAQDGLLVETTARLLPGHPVDLVLDTGGAQVSVRGLVAHSRVCAVRGVAELRYHAGLGLAARTNYSHTEAAGASRERTTRAESSAFPCNASEGR